MKSQWDILAELVIALEFIQLHGLSNELVAISKICYVGIKFVIILIFSYTCTGNLMQLGFRIARSTIYHQSKQNLLCGYQIGDNI